MRGHLKCVEHYYRSVINSNDTCILVLPGFIQVCLTNHNKIFDKFSKGRILSLNNLGQGNNNKTLLELCNLWELLCKESKQFDWVMILNQLIINKRAKESETLINWQHWCNHRSCNYNLTKIDLLT